MGAGRFQRTLVAALWPNPINLNCTHTHRLSLSVSLPHPLTLSLGARTASRLRLGRKSFRASDIINIFGFCIFEGAAIAQSRPQWLR